MANPMMALTAKQAEFVKQYLFDRNGTAAAQRAGYSAASAKSYASELLSSPKIQEAIAFEQQARNVTLKVTEEAIVAELAYIAFGSIDSLFEITRNGEGKTIDVQIRPVNEWTKDAARMVAGVEFEMLYSGRGAERTETGRIAKIKTWSKTDALRILAQYRGMLSRTGGEGPGSKGNPLHLLLQTLQGSDDSFTPHPDNANPAGDVRMEDEDEDLGPASEYAEGGGGTAETEADKDEEII